ncbi:MAG: heparinase II/III family protein [Deltaproteobacteria bacterium]|nr:heparinase II/III family protein [Deltaproteobacteria bacterium]
MKLVGRIATVGRTLAHLRPGQIAWRAVHVARLQAYRHAPGLGARLVRADAGARAADLPAFEIPAVEPWRVDWWRKGFVAYQGVQGARDDWQGEGQSRLWRYERHYHVELPALAAAGLDEARALVEDWLLRNPPCAGEAWEPYPVARRLLNWSLAGAIAPPLRAHLAPWLAAQMRFLAGHLERHLLGNHLLCDLCALVAAAASVETDDAQAVGERAARRLEHELARQTLPDGGYAERTVQYHFQVVHDALLALALWQARGRALGIGLTLARMLRWMEWVRRADGSYPWLNDASPDGMPALAVIRALAKVADVAADAGSPPAAIELPDTGWTILRKDGDELLFDHGVVGPRHQPGHGHADALSFELVWNDVPVVTDTGVTTYAAGEVRAFERSAAAHATVTVDSHGADETWASFRVGGRGRPVYFGKVSPWPGALLLRARAASYRGFVHRRALLFWPRRALVVADGIAQARAGAGIVSSVPLAPEWTVAAAETGCVIHSKDARLDVSVLRGRLLEARRGRYPDEPGWVARGFGRGEGRVTLALGADGDGRVLYAIGAPHVHVAVRGEGLILTDGETEHELPLADLLQ